MAKNKVVYVLGAGFSKEAGGLLMTQFFERNELRSRRKRLNRIYLEIKNFRRQALKSGLVTSKNIEEFFNIASEADLLQLKFQNSSREAWEASNIFEGLIDCVIEELHSNITKALPSHYDMFAELLDEDKTSIITFNWDDIIERLLWEKYGVLDYCFDDENMDIIKSNTALSNGIKLLKLHGSVNWLICENDHISFYEDWKCNKSRLSKCQAPECNSPREKLIVPPVWNKRGYFSAIKHLWARAADELCDANKVVFIGYSMSEHDFSAKHLFLLCDYINKGLTVEIVNGPCFCDHDFMRFKNLFRNASKVANTKLDFKEYVSQ